MALSNGPNTGLLENGEAGDEHYDELMHQWRWLDFFLNPNVIAMDVATPPSEPENGDAYIVAAEATGDWADKEGQIARWTENLPEPAWEFFEPSEGTALIKNLDDGKRYQFNGEEWEEFAPAGEGGGEPGGPPATVTISGTSHDIVAANAGKYLRFTNTSAKTCTFQPDSDEALEEDSEFHIRNAGVGELTMVAGTGVTLNPPFGGSLVLQIGMTVTVKRVGEDVFDIMGHTDPAEEE